MSDKDDKKLLHFQPTKDQTSSLFDETHLKDAGKLNKPWKRGKWLIWPGTILSSINIFNCDDTVEGLCYGDTTIEECMDRCPADNCGAGLYVRFRDGKSMCVPIRTVIHYKISPLYRLRNQSLYNLDPNLVEMSVFVNTEQFPFPPNLSNTIFFGDIISFEDAENGRALDTTSPVQNGPGPCILKKDATSVLTIHPYFRMAKTIVNDRPIVYGDKLVLAVTGTSYVMQVDQGGGINPLVWRESLGVLGGTGIAFRLAPVDPKKKRGDLVTYSDTVSLMYEGIGMVAVRSEEDNLYLSTSPILMNQKAFNKSKESGLAEYVNHTFSSKHADSPFNVYFKFKSLMKNYYCDDGGSCKTVSPGDIVPAHFPGKWDKAPPPYVLSSGTYKGKSVYNHSGCWDLCGDEKPGKGTGTTVVLAGDQHLPAFATSPLAPLWEKNKKGNMKIALVVVGIVVTILMIITGVFIYKRTRKQA